MQTANNAASNSNAATWENDDAMCDAVGDAWTEDMDVGRCDMQTAEGRHAAVDIANCWLEENGRTERVMDVRENEECDNLDWMLA